MLEGGVGLVGCNSAPACRLDEGGQREQKSARWMRRAGSLYLRPHHGQAWGAHGTTLKLCHVAVPLALPHITSPTVPDPVWTSLRTPWGWLWRGRWHHLQGGRAVERVVGSRVRQA